MFGHLKVPLNNRFFPFRNGTVYKAIDFLEDVMDRNGQDVYECPYLIFNCDEPTIYINKSSKKVIVPQKHRHTDSILHGTSQQTCVFTVLCWVSASGTSISPRVVFYKCLPVGRSCHQNEPINGAYSQSDSGCVPMADLELVSFQVTPYRRGDLKSSDGVTKERHWCISLNMYRKRSLV